MHTINHKLCALGEPGTAEPKEFSFPIHRLSQEYIFLGFSPRDDPLYLHQKFDNISADDLRYYNFNQRATYCPNYLINRIIIN